MNEDMQLLKMRLQEMADKLNKKMDDPECSGEIFVRSTGGLDAIEELSDFFNLGVGLYT